MKGEVLDLGVAKIKLTPREEKKIVIIGNCPFCDKKVKGSTRSQVEWNLALHIKQKHKKEKNAKILLKQLEKQMELRKW